MTQVCVFEAKLALMYAAGQAFDARDRHDPEGLALWRGRADEAREWLRRASAAAAGQLTLGIAA